MVQIQEQIEEQEHVIHHHHPQTKPSSHPNQHEMDPSSSSSFHHPTTTPPPATDSPTSSPSSISSDHTFHGFSPIKETLCFPSPSPSPMIPISPPPPVQSLVPVQGANRLVHDQPEAVTKTEKDAQTGFTGENITRTARPGQRRVKVKGLKFMRKVGLALRFCEFAMCLVSFTVMASDKNRGWALDSFDRYVEFRYAMSINVIGFAYSGLQGLDLLHQLTTGKDVGSHVRYSFDFAIDQILAYILLSASSSAFTRVDDWISNWGNDKFPAMASASVGVSFVAFIAFALSSLISGYLLCTNKFA